MAKTMREQRVTIDASAVGIGTSETSVKEWCFIMNMLSRAVWHMADDYDASDFKITIARVIK